MGAQRLTRRQRRERGTWRAGRALGGGAGGNDREGGQARDERQRGPAPRRQAGPGSAAALLADARRPLAAQGHALAQGGLRRALRAREGAGLAFRERSCLMPRPKKERRSEGPQFRTSKGWVARVWEQDGSCSGWLPLG